MANVVRKTGTSPSEKVEQERKRSQSIYAPLLRVLSNVSLAGKAKLSLVGQNVRDFISMLFTHII